MGKKEDNRRVVATDEQRAYASNMTVAKRAQSDWKVIEQENREGLLESLHGETGVTLVMDDSDDSEEVAAVVESDPTQSVDWAKYRKDHPELEPVFQKYLKPATTKTTVYTTYVERNPHGEQGSEELELEVDEDSSAA